MVEEVDQPASEQLILLILQFLKEENYTSALHSLERESKVFFNLEYFFETMENGEWEGAEKYLSAFTRFDDNDYSLEIFNELHRHRYCETLAREIGELTWDVTATRDELRSVLNSLILRNPILQPKLYFPVLNKSGLLSIIRLTCSNPQKNARMLTEALIYLIFQFLYEENFCETLLELEREAAIFFNMRSFELFLLRREWDNAEKYLSAFTNPEDNWHSFMLFYEIIKQKFFEAVYRNNDDISLYVSTARCRLHNNLNSLTNQNQSLQDKVKFPCMDKSRLLTIVNRMMDWWVPYSGNARLNGSRAISLEGIPQVPSLFSSYVTNMLSEGTTVPVDQENPLLLLWRIAEADFEILSFMVTKHNGETSADDDSWEE